MTLDTKYRPSDLNSIYGQEKVVSFFKSVLKNVGSAPHYYLISGSFGTGKSTLARAFARDLLGSLSPPSYIEIDSGEKSLQNNFEAIKNIMFQDIGSYKVVTLDESGLLPENSQQQLLKIVEDYYGPLVLFFCTTDPHKMLGPLRSRLHHFSLSLFSEEQLKEYGRWILEQEKAVVSDQVLSMAALNAQGHMRNMVKQLELALFQGEEEYLSFYASILREIVAFFVDFSINDKVSVENMSRWHPSELRSLMGYFFREDIINPDGKYKDAIPRHLVPKCFAAYLRLMGLVKNPDDFFSAILVFRSQLRALRGV